MRKLENPVKKHPLYRAWRAMMERCHNPRNKDYHNYGQRGISVCDEWHDFRRFAIDVGERPPKMTLERKDNNGSYCPANCHWATVKEQRRNSRQNSVIVHNGKQMPIVAWSEETGLPQHVISHRLHMGWPAERILTTPVGKYRDRITQN